MPIKLANNASTRLAAPITSAATSLTVESGGGDKFPITGDDVFFPMTIVAADGQLEIVKCTARSGDTFTVERAQEGTTAKDFSAGAAVELRFTAGAAEALLDQMEGMIEDAKQDLEDRIDTVEGYKVGDYLTTARNPGANWLRRDGSSYPKEDYPDLALLMPDAPKEYSVIASSILSSAQPPTGANFMPGTPLAFHDGVYYYVAKTGTTSRALYKSTNFLDWTLVSTIGTALTEYVQATTGIAISNDGIIMISGFTSTRSTKRSSDGGLTWTDISYSGTSNYIQNVVYDPVADVFIGYTRSDLAALGTTRVQDIYVSNVGGTTWTKKRTVGDSGSRSAFGGYANGIHFCSVNASGSNVILRSSDLWATSTAVTLPGGISATNSIAVAYFKGKYYLQNGSNIFESTDAETWTLSTTSQLTNALFASSKIMTNNRGIITRDGINWEDATNIGHANAYFICDDEEENGKLYKLSPQGSDTVFEIIVGPIDDAFIVPNDGGGNNWIKAK